MVKRQQLIFTGLIFFLLTGIVLSIMYGPVNLTIVEVFNALFFSEDTNNVNSKIIWQLRFPRTFAALLAGASLSVSGLLMQTFFRNPIAGPDVLGVSSGAGLGAALWIMGAAGFVSAGVINIPEYFNYWGLVSAACLGALLILLLILMISGFMSDINSLLIVGMMLASVGSALVMLLQFFSGREELQQFILWGMGDLGGISWSELWILMPITFVAILVSYLLAKSLNVMLLGETAALSLGVSVKRLKWQIITLTAVLAGSITAFCGPLAFVGVAVPHLSRMLFQSNRHQVLILGASLLGMTILVYCQLLSQIILTDKILPINIITSILGAPAVLWIILKMRR